MDLLSQEFESLFCTLPLRTPSELLSYQQNLNIRRLIEPLNLTGRLPKGNQCSNKLLLCHDMCGNYLSDRYYYGSVYEYPFQITDWSMIDIFCYFSHNLVTIPSLSIINVCKRNGVDIIGTFITEWELGTEYCVSLFTDRSVVDIVIDKLIEISEDYALDGWLINIENQLPSSDIVDNMLYFLNRLSAKFRILFPTSTGILWYDSVTIDGKLNWQDGLTSSNKAFYDNCDGIFINYTWGKTIQVISNGANDDCVIPESRNIPSSLAHSIQLLLQSKNSEVMSIADISPQRLFYGIDVFGRGSYGGGGYNCSAAIDVLKCSIEECTNTIDQNCDRNYCYNKSSHNDCLTSIAIFAPGWVLETQVSNGCNNLFTANDNNFYKRFEEIQHEITSKTELFWRNIRESWQSKITDKFTSLNILPNHNMSAGMNYFYTSFSTACGVAVFLNGVSYAHPDIANSQYMQLKIKLSENNTQSDSLQIYFPYYDLSLHNYNSYFVNSQDSRSIESRESYSWKVYPRFDIGWNGSGCLCFKRVPNFDNQESSQEVLIPQIPFVGVTLHSSTTNSCSNNRGLYFKTICSDSNSSTVICVFKVYATYVSNDIEKNTHFEIYLFANDKISFCSPSQIPHVVLIPSSSLIHPRPKSTQIESLLEISETNDTIWIEYSYFISEYDLLQFFKQQMKGDQGDPCNIDCSVVFTLGECQQFPHMMCANDQECWCAIGLLHACVSSNTRIISRTESVLSLEPVPFSVELPNWDVQLSVPRQCPISKRFAIFLHWEACLQFDDMKMNPLEYFLFAIPSGCSSSKTVYDLWEHNLLTSNYKVIPGGIGSCVSSHNISLQYENLVYLGNTRATSFQFNLSPHYGVKLETDFARCSKIPLLLVDDMELNSITPTLFSVLLVPFHPISITDLSRNSNPIFFFALSNTSTE